MPPFLAADRNAGQPRVMTMTMTMQLLSGGLLLVPSSLVHLCVPVGAGWPNCKGHSNSRDRLMLKLGAAKKEAGRA